jgi:hypothetical protein
MENGWVKLHRRIFDWEWFSDSKTFHVFMYLILNANHKPKKWKGVQVGIGQLVTGRDAISTATGISQQSVRTCLTRLESTGEITRKSTNKFSIVTICNFYKYQPMECYDQPTINQQSTNNQPTTNHKQELKNERIKEKTYLGDSGFLDEIKKIHSYHMASNGGGIILSSSHLAAFKLWEKKGKTIEQIEAAYIHTAGSKTVAGRFGWICQILSEEKSTDKKERIISDGRTTGGPVDL